MTGTLQLTYNTTGAVTYTQPSTLPVREHKWLFYKVSSFILVFSYVKIEGPLIYRKKAEVQVLGIRLHPGMYIIYLRGER